VTPINLVRDDAASDAGPVDHDPAPGLARTDQLGDRHSQIGIIHRFLAVSAHIVDAKTQHVQLGFEDFLELKAAVVRTDRNHFLPRPGNLNRDVGRRIALRRTSQRLPEHALDDRPDLGIVNRFGHKAVFRLSSGLTPKSSERSV